jgi:hypothetical protein
MIVSQKIIIGVNPVLPLHRDLVEAHFAIRAALGLAHADYWRRHPEPRFRDYRDFHVSLDRQMLVLRDLDV